MGRFLLPEDDPCIREFCGTILSAAGHVVDLAKNGCEALERVHAFECDAIVSDGHMPKMDGPTFLGEARSHTFCRIPTAFKSGLSHDELLRRGLRIGVGWIVQKPFRYQDLLNVCEEMLQVRVEWLCASQPSVLLPPRAGGRWVELEALETTLGRAPDAEDAEVERESDTRILHAASPRAAVEALAAHVHHWRWMIRNSAPAEQVLSTAIEMHKRLEGSAAKNHVIRLEDEALREDCTDLPEPLRTRVYLALACARRGWRWRLDRHTELAVSEPVEVHQVGGRLHCATGPAVRYRDGWALYALHGVLVPRYVVETLDTTATQDARRTSEQETPALMRVPRRERRSPVASCAALLHADTVPVDALVPGGRTITRALVEDYEGARFLVASDGSTHRVHYMQVPRECTTCQEAYVALSDRRNVRTIMQT